MVHTLKRIYLYTAATFALLFTAGVLVNLLYVLFQAAGLRPRYYYLENGPVYAPPPTSQEIAQSVVLFVVVALLVGALFGGGHYWLIRRDARSDPNADAGPTRHLFLNALLASATLVMVPASLSAIADLTSAYGGADAAFSLALALVAGLVFLLVMVERGRVNLASRAAGMIRQIHENVVQGILVLIASGILLSAFSTLVRWVLVTTNQGGCPLYTDPADCTPPDVLRPVLQVGVMLIAWSLYVWLGVGTWGAVLQRALWFVVFGYGVIWLLVGVEQTIFPMAASLFGETNAWRAQLENALPFVSTLLTAALLVLPYARWLRGEAKRRPEHQPAIEQGILGIVAGVSLLFFLTGLVLLLAGLVEQVVPDGSRLEAGDWATAVSILIAGLGYLPCWLPLLRVSDPAQTGPVIPRRAYVLTMLALTAIPALIAVVVFVFQMVAIPLDLELASRVVARQSAVAALVLAGAALYHLLRLREDLRLSHARAAATASASGSAETAPAPSGGVPAERAVASTAGASATSATTAIGKPESLVGVAEAAPAEPETLESILRLVAAGTLDPIVAATRIRQLSSL